MESMSAGEEAKAGAAGMPGLTKEREDEIRARAAYYPDRDNADKDRALLLRALDAAREEAKREKAAREEAEAGAAAMREALDELTDHHCGGYGGDYEEARGYRKHSSVMAEVAAALSASAGSDLLAEVRALREVADAAREAVAAPSGMALSTFDKLANRLAAIHVAAGEGR